MELSPVPLSPLEHPGNEYAMQLLPREDDLLQPQALSMLRDLLLAPAPQASAQDRANKAQLRTAAQDRIDPLKIKIQKRKGDFAKLMNLNRQLVEQGKKNPELASGFLVQLKLKMFKENQLATDILIKEASDLIPKYRSLFQDGKLEKSCIECMRDLLDERHEISYPHFPWQKHPLVEAVARQAAPEQADQVEHYQKQQEEMAKIYPDGAPADWATAISLQHRFLLGRMFARWVPQLSPEVEKNAIKNHLSMFKNLHLAAMMVNYDRKKMDVVVGLLPRAKVTPEMVRATVERGLDAKPSISRPLEKESEQWAGSFQLELDEITSMAMEKLDAVFELLQDSRQSRPSLPKEYRNTGTLKRLATDLGILVESLQSLEQLLIRKCGTVLAGTDPAAQFVNAKLSTIRYYVSMADSVKGHALELAQARFGFPWPKPKTGKTAAAAGGAAKDAPKIDPGTVAELVEALQDEKAVPEQEPDSAKPSKKKRGKPESVKRDPASGSAKGEEPEEGGFLAAKDLVFGRLKAAKDAMARFDEEIKSRPPSFTLGGQIARLRNDMKKQAEVQKQFQAAKEAMGAYQWIGKLTQEKLQTHISACMQKIERCQLCLDDAVCQPMNAEVFKELEGRSDFGMKLVPSEEVLKKRGLLVFNVSFPKFVLWDGYAIQRPSQSPFVQAHFHVTDVPNFKKLFALAPKELEKAIATGHVKIQHKPEKGSDSEPGIEREKDKPEGALTEWFTFPSDYSAKLVLKWGKDPTCVR